MVNLWLQPWTTYGCSDTFEVRSQALMNVIAPKRHNRRPPLNRLHRQTPVKFHQLKPLLPKF